MNERIENYRLLKISTGKLTSYDVKTPEEALHSFRKQFDDWINESEKDENMTNDESKAEYAIVELMGHNKIAGLVSEVAKFGATLLRVDVPEVNGRPSYTRFFNAQNSLYSITMVNEETAKLFAAKHQQTPINQWEIRNYLLKPEDEDCEF